MTTPLRPLAVTHLYTVYYTDSTGSDPALNDDEQRIEIQAVNADAARAEVESWGVDVSAVI